MRRKPDFSPSEAGEALDAVREAYGDEGRRACEYELWSGNVPPGIGSVRGRDRNDVATDIAVCAEVDDGVVGAEDASVVVTPGLGVGRAHAGVAWGFGAGTRGGAAKGGLVGG